MRIPRPLAWSSTIFDTHGTIDEEVMEIERGKSERRPITEHNP